MAIWVILILAALVLVYTRTMRVELIASGNRLASEQAAAVQRGAEQYVLARVDGAKGDALDVTAAPAEAVPVGGGYFWILRPTVGDPRNFEYGIVDEASKLNLNVADAARIELLPGMTQEFSLVIADWRDADDEVSSGEGGTGAESEYYLAQPQPYEAKNDPFETVEELRLLKNATDGLVFGYDRNQNGAADDVWPMQSSVPGAPAGQPMLFGIEADERGLFPFVTTMSVEMNVDAKGNPRVNVKSDDAPQAPGGPGQPGGGAQPAPQPGAPRAAQQVVQPAPTPTPPQPGQPGQPGQGEDGTEAAIKEVLTEALQGQRANDILTQARARTPFANVFDFAVKGNMTRNELSQVLDRLSPSGDKSIKGRVNVLTAPREVLRCLPGLNGEAADDIIAMRPTERGGDAAFVIDALSPTQITDAGASITDRSYQYSADIVAVSGDGRAFKRVRIVVDARQSPPVVVRRKDLTSLGWPLPEVIRQQLRQGVIPHTGFRDVRPQGAR